MQSSFVIAYAEAVTIPAGCKTLSQKHAPIQVVCLSWPNLIFDRLVKPTMVFISIGRYSIWFDILSCKWRMEICVDRSSDAAKRFEVNISKRGESRSDRPQKENQTREGDLKNGWF